MILLTRPGEQERGLSFIVEPEFQGYGRHCRVLFSFFCLVVVNADLWQSATIVLAYLMAHKQMTLDDAYAFLQSKRPQIRPNSYFMEQLEHYERTLRYRQPLKPQQILHAD